MSPLHKERRAEGPARKRFRTHQRTIFKYTLEQDHPFLAVEMRLGKCLVTIRRCKLYKPRSPEIGLKILIVAPSGAIGSWEHELTCENEDYITLDGTTTEKIFKLQCKRTFYIANKEAFLYIGQELLHTWLWDAVVTDESFLKNPKAKITRFFTGNFRSVPHRWVLSGTPNPENDLEFFPQLQFLHGNAFGFKNYYQFRARCWEPDAINEHGWVPKYGTQQIIRTHLAQKVCIMSRKDAGIETFKSYHPRELSFPKDIELMYRKIENEMELPDETTTIWSMTAYQWLRKLCGGFLETTAKDTTISYLQWTGKQKEVISLLKGELAKQKVVIWFFYNHEIQSMADALFSVGIPSSTLWGKEDRIKREVVRKYWAESPIETVILVQQACAQMGMDLSAADTAIYYSEPPGTLASLQTEDRIVNLNKSTPLQYIHLTVKNTVDSDLRNALKMKKFNSSLTLSAALRQQLEARRNGYR